MPKNDSKLNPEVIARHSTAEFPCLEQDVFAIVLETMKHVLNSIPQVAVLLPTSMKISRDMRRGILRYARLCGPWTLHIVEGRIGEKAAEYLKDGICDGIIGRLFTPELDRAVHDSHAPLVLIDPEKSRKEKSPLIRKHSVIRSDTLAVGRMAAEYFLEKRFTHFAYLPAPTPLAWSTRRGESFAATVRAKGFACTIFRGGGLSRQLDAWLLALPKPTALLTAMDSRGREVLDACARVKISVPQEIAVLGVDNDEDLCETTLPPMSSICLDAERAGFRAAELLDKLMRQRTHKREVIVYGPLHVVTRRSTEAMQIQDALILQACDFIAANACSGIGVPDVVRRVRTSRRVAEQRFRAVLGRTILDEIHRCQFEKICLMLRETNAPISEITNRCGFASESHLGVLFRRRFGCTMRAFRKDAAP